MSNNKPSFIVSTANFVATYSDDKGIVKIAEGEGTYYGLSWDENSVFILRRCDAVGGKRSLDGAVTGDIYSVDKEYNYLSSLEGEFPGAHSMIYDDGDVYITATRINSVGVTSTTDKDVEFKNWTGHCTDVNHINSIWKDPDGSFWCTYHNWTTKEGGESSSLCVNLDKNLTTILSSIEVGLGVHNSVRVGRTLYVCSSQDGYLVLYDLDLRKEINRKYIGKWVRGIGITDNYIVLGVTAPAERASRGRGDSEVIFVDRDSLDIVDKVVISNSGSIYELRVIGEHDYAHNGIAFPGTSF